MSFTAYAVVHASMLFIQPGVWGRTQHDTISCVNETQQHPINWIPCLTNPLRPVALLDSNRMTIGSRGRPNGRYFGECGCQRNSHITSDEWMHAIPTGVFFYFLNYMYLYRKLIRMIRIFHSDIFHLASCSHTEWLASEWLECTFDSTTTAAAFCILRGKKVLTSRWWMDEWMEPTVIIDGESKSHCEINFKLDKHLLKLVFVETSSLEVEKKDTNLCDRRK